MARAALPQLILRTPATLMALFERVSTFTVETRDWMANFLSEYDLELAQRSRMAVYSVSGTAVASGAKFTLSALSGIGDGDYFSLSANTITVQQAGLYLIAFAGFVRSASVANPEGVPVDVDGSALAGTIHIVGRRFSATPADGVLVSGTYLAPMSARGTLFVLNANSVNATIDPAGIARLSVVRLRSD